MNSCPAAFEEIGDYSLILEKMGIDAELLPSPSGVIVVGSSEEVSKARTAVQTIHDQKQVFDSTEDSRTYLPSSEELQAGATRYSPVISATSWAKIYILESLLLQQ